MKRKNVCKNLKKNKLDDVKYISLNGSMLNKIRGGEGGSGWTDRLCGTGCGATSAFKK